jgi:arginyl-tRNA synthetase
MSDILISDTNEKVDGTQVLERVIARFPEIIARAQTEWSPHYLVTYLTELAQYFNSWYGQGKIIDDDKEKTTYRLLVTRAVECTLTKGLSLLGIEVPERM